MKIHCILKVGILMIGSFVVSCNSEVQDQRSSQIVAQEEDAIKDDTKPGEKPTEELRRDNRDEIIELAGFSLSGYCASGGATVFWEWIEAISFAGLENISGSNDGYTDFSKMPIKLQPGDHNIILTPGFNLDLFPAQFGYSENWRVWLDFNRDSAFSDEEVVLSAVSLEVINGIVTIPNNIKPGPIAMRVSMRYGFVPPSCGQFAYGEVEDYLIELEAAPSQHLPPLAGYVAAQATGFSGITNDEQQDADLNGDGAVNSLDVGLTVNLCENSDEQFVKDTRQSLANIVAKHVTGFAGLDGLDEVYHLLDLNNDDGINALDVGLVINEICPYIQ